MLSASSYLLAKLKPLLLLPTVSQQTTIERSGRKRKQLALHSPEQAISSYRDTSSTLIQNTAKSSTVVSTKTTRSRGKGVIPTCQSSVPSVESCKHGLATTKKSSTLKYMPATETSLEIAMGDRYSNAVVKLEMLSPDLHKKLSSFGK